MTYRFLVVGSLYNIYCAVVLNQRPTNYTTTGRMVTKVPVTNTYINPCPLLCDSILLVSFTVWIIPQLLMEKIIILTIIMCFLIFHNRVIFYINYRIKTKSIHCSITETPQEYVAHIIFILLWINSWQKFAKNTVR